MKYLILDVDGVIRIPNFGIADTKWGRVHTFDERPVSVLNKILDATDAEIILSSDWKLNHSLEDMQGIFGYFGIKKGPITYTINHPREDNVHAKRAEEIKEYIERHRINNWVAIDDIPLLDVDEHFTDFFVHNFIHCHANIGLTDEQGERAIKILNKND